MKSILKKTAQALLLVPVFALSLSLASPLVGVAAAADDLTIGGGAGSAQGTSQEGVCIFRDSEGNPCDNDIFKTITNVLLFIIGAISVIMLIIGGIRYTVSGGDSSAVTGAKNTILYAIVGIVVAILAYAVVNFVIGSFAGGA